MQPNTEEQILEAAKKVFIQKGYAGARMQEIADAAGINKAMLHYYFRSKDRLFQVIFEQTMGIIVPKFAQAIGSKGTIMEKLEIIIRTYISTLREQPHMPMFIMHELGQNRHGFILEMKNKLSFFPDFVSFFQQIEAEVATGKIAPTPAPQLLLHVMSLCVFPFLARPIFCTLLDMPQSQFDQLMEQRADEVVRFVKQALQA